MGTRAQGGCDAELFSIVFAVASCPLHLPFHSIEKVEREKSYHFTPGLLRVWRHELFIFNSYAYVHALMVCMHNLLGVENSYCIITLKK